LVVLLRWYNQENLDRPIAARRRLKPFYLTFCCSKAANNSFHCFSGFSPLLIPPRSRSTGTLK